MALENFLGLSLCVYVCVCTVCGQSLALFLYFSVLVCEKRWEKCLQSYKCLVKGNQTRIWWGCMTISNMSLMNWVSQQNVESHWNHASEPGEMIQVLFFYGPSTWKQKKKINLWFSLFWKSPFLQHQNVMLGECGCRNLHLSCWPVLSCFCASSQTHAFVRALWGRDPTFVLFCFVFWHSIWHGKVWIYNQLLWTRTKHFWHDQYLRTNQTFKTACCSCARLLCTGEFFPLRFHYGAGFYVQFKVGDLGNTHGLCLTPPTLLIASVQLCLRPMLRRRIGNLSGFWKKKMAKECNYIFTTGSVSKVSDPCTAKGVHCSKWMGMSSSTGGLWEAVWLLNT